MYLLFWACAPFFRLLKIRRDFVSFFFGIESVIFAGPITEPNAKGPKLSKSFDTRFILNEFTKMTAHQVKMGYANMEVILFIVTSIKLENKFVHSCLYITFLKHWNSNWINEADKINCSGCSFKRGGNQSVGESWFRSLAAVC